MYYIIDESIKDVGSTFPQNQEMGKGYDYDASNSVFQLRKPQNDKFVPNLNTIILDRKAKLTDLISSSPIPSNCLIITEKLKNIIVQFNLPPHRIYQAPVKHGFRNINGYYLLVLQPSTEAMNFLDYSKSNFFLKNYGNNKKEKIEINSEIEFHRINNNLLQNQDFYCTSYSFKKGYLGRFDLFDNGRLDVDKYISEELKKEIEHAAVSGVEIRNTKHMKY